jgi:glycosyltransferase involved in cell wall biosynthesis
VVKQRRLYGFPANPLARQGTFYAGFDPLRAVCVLLLDRSADVVVSVGESNIALILLLARLLRFKPRIVLREISARGWGRRDRVVDYVLPRVDRVLALTPHQTAWAPLHWRLKAPPDLVGFAIDEGFFTPKDCPDGGYVLAVGDDVGRDYACLVAACRDTPYRLLLRTDTQPAIPADMAERVTILGRLSYLELRDLYAAASIVAVPLQQIDHPSGITALFEGMAMGRAVVASDVGTAQGVIEDGTNGVLVGSGDPEAMRRAIIRLMDDAALRRRLGASARRTIETECSYAAYVRRFAASLTAVLA